MAVSTVFMAVAAGRAVHQHPGLSRRRALARGLWRRGRGRRDGGGAVGRAHGRAVPHHRAEAHAARGPDRRRHRRRRLRHRPADRRDPVLRHPLLPGVPEVGPAGRRSCRRSTAWCGGRRAPCWATSARSPWCSARALALLAAAIAIFSARFGEHAIAAAGVSDGGVPQRRRRSGFRRLSPRGALRRKEWTLLLPRSVARLADADAASLSAAAGADAVARLRQPTATTSCCWCRCW